MGIQLKDNCGYLVLSHSRTLSLVNKQIAEKRFGFSLVELSIVLVILGLLVGGVLSGQSLIRAAELRSVTTDFTRYSTSLYTFRDKYFALPGDMTNATSFWGKQNTGTENCTGDTAAAGTPGTCNGNGDGLINIGQEGHRAWQQLALAGLIEGSYTGYNGGGTGCGGLCDDVAGVNVPKARLGNGGYSFIRTGQDTVGDVALIFSTQLSSSWTGFIVGAKQVNFYYNLSILKPEEAWNIDTKVDDGRPQYGSIFPYRNTTCTTTNDPVTTDYALTSNNVACNLIYRVQ